jgi:hypothetical protein
MISAHKRRHDSLDDLLSADRREVGVKYYHFDSLYESGSFGRAAPEENFGGFILSFPILRPEPRLGGAGGSAPREEKNRF